MANITVYGHLTSPNKSDSDAIHHFSFPLMTWGTLVISVTGTIANTLIIIVILSSHLRKSVFMNILAFLAIADNIRLWSVLSIREGIFGLLGFGESLTLCRICIFTLYTSGTISSWLVVLISLERLIAVYYPLKVRIYCTLKRINLGILVIIILSCVPSIFYFQGCSVIAKHYGKPYCASAGSDTNMNIIRSLVSFSLYIATPFFVIAILNILIVVKLKKQMAFRAKSVGKANSKTGTSMIAMMAATCIIFAVTSFPKMILIIGSNGCRLFGGENCLSVSSTFGNLAYLLGDLNHSTNFFIYCLSGSVFRNALLQFFNANKKPLTRAEFKSITSVSKNVN